MDKRIIRIGSDHMLTDGGGATNAVIAVPAAMMSKYGLVPFYFQSSSWWKKVGEQHTLRDRIDDYALDEPLAFL